ncbi:MAG TPA: hypothetical protein VFJ93_03640 [Gaiellaceae bacterium]|nr:hypothetical protein [Gaiellaceae bacterium]
MRRSAVACLVLCLVGCGTSQPSRSEQRTTARAFAAEVVAGHARVARSFVAKHADPAVRQQAKLLSADFANHPARLVGRPRRTGEAQWAFAYRRRIKGENGAFSREHGFLVVDTGGASGGVTFAAIIGRVIEYSTHHDSELLPSKR